MLETGIVERDWGGRLWLALESKGQRCWGGCKGNRQELNSIWMRQRDMLKMDTLMQ
jgi:hypothetical protein